MNNYNFVHDEGVITITVENEQTARDVLNNLVKDTNQWNLDSVEPIYKRATTGGVTLEKITQAEGQGRHRKFLRRMLGPGRAR